MKAATPVSYQLLRRPTLMGVGFREMWVQGLRFRIQGVGFRIQGLGFRALGFEFRIQGLWFRELEAEVEP